VTLPKGLQEAFLEDCLTDCLVPELDNKRLTSIEDATSYVANQLPKLINLSDALIVSGVIKRIALKLMLYSNAAPVPSDGSLSKLLKATKLKESNTVPLVQLNTVDGDVRVTILVPDFNDQDTVSKRNLETLATLAHYGLGVSAEKIFIYKDPSQGNEIRFESQIQKMMDDLSASAASTHGAYAGVDIRIGSYNGNLPTILATLHLLNIKQTFLRKKTPKKGETVSYVNSQELRNSFNQRSGITNSNSYAMKVVKSLLATITSVKNKRFPGSWIRSNRTRNNVKSDLGLISVLGYTEKIPYNHKLHTVIFNDTVVSPNGKLRIRTKSDETEFKELSFLEFRSAVALTAPRVSPKNQDAPSKQIGVEPLHVRSATMIKCFDDPKYFKSIDRLNRAHAILVAQGRSTSKSSPVHYEQARNEFLHSTAKIPIKDHTGKEYDSIKELPKPLLEFLCRLYRFQYGKKRKAEDNKDSADAMDVEATASIPDPPASKKPKKGAMPPPGSKKGDLKRSPSVRGRFRPATPGSLQGPSNDS
jgi:hypothetical protein